MKTKTETKEGMRYQSSKTSRTMNTATEEVNITPFLNMTVFSYTKTAPVVIVDLSRNITAGPNYLHTPRSTRFSLSGEPNNN